MSFKSTQDLVNRAIEIYLNEQQKDAMLFGTYLEQWFERYKRPMLEKNTANNYCCMIKNHILPVIGQKPLADIAVKDIQQIVSSLQSASMAKQVKSIINLVIDAAIADELYVHPNPTQDKRIRMPDGKVKRAALSSAKLADLMACIPNLSPECAQLLSILLMTGCRRSEALGARWEAIDWETNTIHLQRVVRFRNNVPEVSSKMKTASANRSVSLWQNLLPYLGEPQDSGFIVCSGEEPLTERQYRIRWGRLMRELKKLGFDETFTAHQLRHTYATVAANSGSIPIKVLQGMMGHANFQTTMNTYAHIDEEKIRQSSLELGEKYAEMARKVADKS